MERLRERWWVALIVTLVFGAAILLLAPHYNDAQMAGDVSAFRTAVLDDGEGNTVAAAVADILFCIAYAVLALALVRRSVLTRVGAGLVLLGGAADLVENVQMWLAAGDLDGVTQSTVDAIGTAGTIKWIAIIAGVLIQLTGLALSRRTDPVPEG